MDIIKPTGIDFSYVGGQLAATWGDCSRSAEKYESLVVPYVKSAIEPMFNIVEARDREPPVGEAQPYTYVIGGSKDDWVITRDELTEKAKASGTFKEFEKERRAGNIVLKPMRNCKIFGTATPKIYSPHTPIDYHINRYQYSNIGATYPGICRENWAAFPMLECDSFATATRVLRKRFYDATAIPVPQSELNRVMRLVKAELDNIEPDQDLVTKVVSEANAATWDIATEIAEAPETIKYILNGVKQGILLLLRAKRDVKQQLSKGALTDISSIWMQYRYALMPIIYGIDDALDVLGMEAVQFQSFRGRKDTRLFDGLDKLGGYTIKSSPSYNNRVFLKYKYDVDASIHQGLQINLAATAWELLPLSFVFDWFFQVGDYLTAAFQPGVVTQHGCQQSVRCKGSLILEGYSSEVLKIDIDYYRCRIINPNAFIGINSDVFISFKRAMDALALSWLLFGKKNRRG